MVMFRLGKGYGQYGKAAKIAVELYSNKNAFSLEDTWIKACKQVTTSIHSINKGCPKGAFLGLCREGKIKDIPADWSINRTYNGEYAVKGLELLRQDPDKYLTDKSLLWRDVMSKCGEEGKSPNGQMDVVIALFMNNLTIYPYENKEL